MPMSVELLLRKNALSASSAFIWRILAILVIVALLANWIWVLFAPRSVSVLPAVQTSSDFQAEHLFGIAPVSIQPVMPVMPNVRLVGVFAPSFAVLEFDGKRQVGLATGHQVVPGATLVEVAKDHVVIERDGVRQQINLESKNSAGRLAASVQSLPSVAAPVTNADASKADDAAVQRVGEIELMHGMGHL
jgi:type II secretory pathway component PulC